jgi:NAD-dependent SIR2 family protein deacetylase
LVHETRLRQAAAAIASADALLVGAGAGMSVDAGIPAYRLNAATRAGSPQALLGALNPMLFTSAPELAWGRAGRQLSLFRETRPHHGYELVHAWSRRAPCGAFVVTSNVDGMFHRAGFPADRILEGHGSLHYLQCTKPCGPEVWSADGWAPELADESEYAAPPLPACPRCGGAARPNIFMFGDQYFSESRAQVQGAALEAWLESVRGRRVAVLECGAGTAVPTIRRKCEAYAHELGAPLIRINPLEPESPADAITLPLGALDALERIDRELR